MYVAQCRGRGLPCAPLIGRPVGHHASCRSAVTDRSPGSDRRRPTAGDPTHLLLAEAGPTVARRTPYDVLGRCVIAPGCCINMHCGCTPCHCDMLNSCRGT